MRSSTRVNVVAAIAILAASCISDAHARATASSRPAGRTFSRSVSTPRETASRPAVDTRSVVSAGNTQRSIADGGSRRSGGSDNNAVSGGGVSTGRTVGNRGSRTDQAPAAPLSRTETAPQAPRAMPSGVSGALPASTPPAQHATGLASSAASGYRKSPFIQGLAGGVVGGFAGNALGHLFFGNHGGGQANYQAGSYGGASGGYGAPAGGYSAPAPAPVNNGGGIGIFDILLIAGIGYLIYRFVIKPRLQTAAPAKSACGNANVAPACAGATAEYGQSPLQGSDLENGIAAIKQTDTGFSEEQFGRLAADVFYKVQGAWMHRDMTPVLSLLEDEVKNVFLANVSALLRDRQTNHLENIAMHATEITEAWLEPTGQQFVTVFFEASLVDYTTSDTDGRVVDGDKTSAVEFGEYWTFTRRSPAEGWKLSAISQE